MSSAPIRVRYVIIGAGVGGLALCARLLKAGVSERDVVALERTPSLEGAHHQGFSLTIQSTSFELLRSLQLLEPLRAQVAHIGSNQTTQSFVYASGHVVRERPIDEQRQRLPLPRAALRAALHALAAPCVHWSQGVVDVSSMPDCSGVRIMCSSGACYVADRVFVCDGVQSPVRKLLATAPPQLHRFPLFNVYGLSPLRDDSAEDEAHWRHREVQVLDGSARLFSKPYSRTLQMWEMCFPGMLWCAVHRALAIVHTTQRRTKLARFMRTPRSTKTATVKPRFDCAWK